MKKFLGLIGLILILCSTAFATSGTLSIAKSVSIAKPIPATNFTYYIAVTCTGDCYGVQVTDTLPTGFSLIGSNPSASLTNGILSWNGGDAALSMTNSSQNLTFWGNVLVYQKQNITNTAEVFGTQGGDALSTTILAMYAPTATITLTKTNTPVATATLTSTLTPTPTIAFGNNSFFQPTPQSGKVLVVPTQGVKYIDRIVFNSLAVTSCAINIYNGTTLLRSMNIYAVGTPVQCYGMQANGLTIDYGTNTGTASIFTTANGMAPVFQSTPGTGIVSIPTPVGLFKKLNVDRIIIDAIGKTPCAVIILDGTTALENVTITAIPQEIREYGRTFAALKINYGPNTGTSMIKTSTGTQNVLYQATPGTGVVSIPTPIVIDKSRSIDQVIFGSLAGVPGTIGIYNGSVLYQTVEALSAPLVVDLNGAYMPSLKFDYGYLTGTAKVICK
jgi:hypothetical protein